MSFCSTCLEVILQSCPETIQVKGLTAATEYYWIITTKFGKLYQKLTTTDAEGVLTIDCSILPEGMLNPHAGAFRLEVRAGANYLTIIPLTLDGESYDCLMLSFADVEGDAGINNLITVAV